MMMMMVWNKVMVLILKLIISKGLLKSLMITFHPGLLTVNLRQLDNMMQYFHKLDKHFISYPVFFLVLVTFSMEFHSLLRLFSIWWIYSVPWGNGCLGSSSGDQNLLSLCRPLCVMWASVSLVGWSVTRSRKGIRLTTVNIGMFMRRIKKYMNKGIFGSICTGWGKGGF